MGEITSSKTKYKELIYLLYYIEVLQGNILDLVDLKLFEHMTTLLPQLFQIWLVKYVSDLCGANVMRYKCKKVADLGCPCCKCPGIKETVLQQLQCPLIPMVWIFKVSVYSLQQLMKG